MQNQKTTADPSSNGKAAHPANEAEASHSLLDPEFQLDESLLADVEVEHVLTTVVVRKPKRTEFFRVHPEFVMDRLALERDTGMEKECYLVTPEIKHLMPEEVRTVRLFTAVTRNGTHLIWPVKLPREDDNHLRNIANSALLIAEEAKTSWVKMAWDRGSGAYEMYRALGHLGEPKWKKDASFRELLNIAFRDKLIDRTDHPVIRELNGEI